MALIFLTGGGMRGGPLHSQLHGAPLVAVTRTAPAYRFFSVDGRFPTVQRVSAGGVAVLGELYDLPLATLGANLLPAEPGELELGTVELADGAWALATVLRQEYRQVAELVDISEIADWRAYRRQGSGT